MSAVSAAQGGVRRPKRWDQPLDPDLTEADVDAIMAFEPFASMDASRFPVSASLRDVVRNDTRLHRYEEGEIVLRNGDFGTSMFVIVEGTIGVVLSPNLPQHLLGRGENRRKSVWQALAQVWRRPDVPELRDFQRRPTGISVDARGDARARLPDIERINAQHNVVQLPKGEMFGEIAALTRSPRLNAVFAETPAVILEIRRPGMRDMLRRDDTFRRHVEKLYRERSLRSHLRESPIFAHLPDEALDLVAEKTLFENYGDFDWQQSFMRINEGTPAERLQNEPVIAQEGHYPDGLLMVRSGFARLSRGMDAGQKTDAYLGAGSLFGLQEIVHNWRTGESLPMQRSLRAIGYCDILRVPTDIVEQYVLPNLRAEDMPPPLETAIAAPAPASEAKLPTEFLEFMVDNRVINGTQTMLIDTDRCVRCDACSEACAVGHNNNPRFNRHGRRIDNIMVANACMHCTDPVCMIGCPTGAIHRNEKTGQVIVNDATCIGCATCANNCPYNNIRMVEIRDASGAFIVDEVTGDPVMKSTKCDLCADQPGGPACQRACPHDALIRVDMSDVDTLAKWLNR